MAAVIFTTGAWLVKFGTMSTENRTARHELRECVSILRKFPEDTIFIAEPAVGIRWENMSPLQTRRSMPENVLPSGWNTFSPLFYAVIRRHGFARGSEILPSAVDNPRVLFILQKVDFGGLITTFLRDHRGQLARVEPVCALSENATIYRLVVDRPAAKE